MQEAIKSVVITVILVSLFEMMLPKGNIKKVALSVMGVITVAMVVSPLIVRLNKLKITHENITVIEEEVKK